MGKNRQKQKKGLDLHAHARWQAATLCGDHAEATRIAEQAAQDDPLLAVNAGEVLYSGRPGVPADAERSAECYLLALDGFNVVEELLRDVPSAAERSGKHARAMAVRAAVLNSHEVAQRRPALGAAPKAARKMQALHKELHCCPTASDGVLSGRAITGLSAGYASWEESKRLEAAGEKDESTAARKAALRCYRHSIEAGAELLRRRKEASSSGRGGRAPAAASFFEDAAIQIAEVSRENLMVLQGHGAALGPEYLHELALEQVTGKTAGAARSTAEGNSMASSFPGAEARLVSYEEEAPRELHPRAPRQKAIVCANLTCVEVSGLSKCSGCGLVRYCSRACQQAHWKAHKPVCRGTEAPAPAAVCIGSTVQLRNLQQQPELNGQRGEVVAFDEQAERWSVRLFGSGEIKKVTEFKLFVVRADVSEDRAVALVEKQEAELRHWGRQIIVSLRPLVCEKPHPSTGRTLFGHFERTWRRWTSRERGAFLAETTERAKAASEPFAWAEMAAHDLSDQKLRTEPEAFPAHMRQVLDGKVDTSALREAIGMKGSLSGERDFCLGINELKGHPNRLQFELRIFEAFCATFRARFAQAFLNLGIDAFDH
mmetsp:Transcript_89730/g.278943  ORF Transcript_89730/g.278943 Transcript_89730/m.278943 type:complete len:601 (-) Transcript_89730:130-1932(-)